MILFIDNEEARMRPWVEELREAGLQVKFISSADAARQALEAADPPQGVVLDLMIPADGEIPDRETGYGTRTGLWLLERFREHHTQVPVVMLTNVDDPGVEDAVLGLGATYRRKRDCGPAKLVELIRSLTSGPS